MWNGEQDYSARHGHYTRGSVQSSLVSVNSGSFDAGESSRCDVDGMLELCKESQWQMMRHGRIQGAGGYANERTQAKTIWGQDYLEL